MADDHGRWERICGRDASAFAAFYRDNAARLCAVPAAASSRRALGRLEMCLRSGEAIGVEERGKIGGDCRGYFLEFIARGIAGQFKALGGGVGSHGDNGTVARVRGGRTCEFVERLLRLLQVVDADIQNDLRTYWFAAHKQAARAVLLIGFGKDPAEAHALLRKGCPGGEPACVVASLCESADYAVRDGLDQGVGLLGGRFFGRSVGGVGTLRF